MTARAQASRLIPATRDEVWRTLTSREGMKAYMMGADVETTWQVGSPIVMSGEYGGKPFRDTGEVRSFEPAQRLSYTHRSGGDAAKEHLVTVELEPEGRGTQVTITQSPADPEHRAEYERTWAKMLEGLEKAVDH